MNKAMETIREERRLDGEANGAPKSDSILLRLSKGYRRSKAEQILRLLKDQEALNSKFKEFDLNDTAKGDDGDDSDNWSIAGSDASSVTELDVKPAKKTLRKQKSGRSKTSIGFHREEQCSDISSDSDFGDSIMRCEENTPKSKITRHKSMNVRSYVRGNVDDNSCDMKQATDFDVASVKSSRPKSSIVSFSARSRRPLVPETSIHIPLSPRTDDAEVNRQRKRISNVKVDPLFRRTGVHGFGESLERRDSVKSEHTHAPSPSNLTPRLSSRKISPVEQGAQDRSPSLSYDQGRAIQSRSVGRSTSFTERGKYADRASRPSRNILSVDSHPLQNQTESSQALGGLRRPAPLQASSGETSLGGIRRPISGSKKTRKYGEMSKSSGRTPLNMISDRTQPVAVMKLPPLEASLKKTVPDRDILCYGKEAMV
ncbi:uncharacterized protein LOC124151494 [Haliotis rufescens]|uniref:uncharacterized protein LOC124151494 n=1 Tax=Haliotis rufescens TaxID=6454 RepID=UPI00201F8E15|nr:uncharacterized protein LOC124151494 [Haliotis rufescens]